MHKKSYHLICFSSKTHEKVIRFNVPMQKSFRVHIFYSINLREKHKKDITCYAISQNYKDIYVN